MLWLPPSERQRRIDRRAEYATSLLVGLAAKERFDDWNRELKQISPYLELVKAHSQARHPALRPGFWHVLYRPPAGVPTILVHEGPDGEYREPDSGLLEMLRRSDLWSDRSIRERERIDRMLEQSRQRRIEREREERIDEVRQRAKAAVNPGVSFTRVPGGWSYRAGARKAA